MRYYLRKDYELIRRKSPEFRSPNSIKLYDSPESEIVTSFASGAAYYKHLPSYMAPIINKHYSEINFKFGRMFGKFAILGDATSTFGSIHNLIIDPSSKVHWTDLAFTLLGWYPIIGDFGTMLYTGAKNQIDIRKEKIMYDRNPLKGVYTPATGDIWFGH